MKTLLVPIDLSDVSAAVVEAVVPIAHAFQAKVHLLFVVRPAIIVNEYSAYVESLNTQRDADAERILADFQAELGRQGIEAETEQYFGVPVDSILAKAEKLNPEYIVMGSHGHTAFYDLLIGSTTAGVLKRARRPVLIVPTRAVLAEAGHAATAAEA